MDWQVFGLGETAKGDVAIGLGVNGAIKRWRNENFFKVVEIETGRSKKQAMRRIGRIHAFAVSENGKRCAFLEDFHNGDIMPRVIDCDGYKEVHGEWDKVHGQGMLFFAGDAALVQLEDWRGRAQGDDALPLRGWNLESGRALEKRGWMLESGVWFSASADGKRVLIVRADGRIYVGRMADGAVVAKLVHGEGIRSRRAALSPSGEFVAIGYDSGEIAIWKLIGS
jgi:hypothetical protein